MSKAFVYTEVQLSVPFDQAPWREFNATIKKQPGFVNKTWLSGYQNNSVGGIYEFDSIENANKFIQDYFPTEAKLLGSAFSGRVFDGSITEEASREMNSVHYS